MGIISNVSSKVGRSVLNTTKKIVSLDRHMETWGWMKAMSKKAFIPKKKLTVAEMKRLANLPANKESFKQAVKKHNASLAKQHNLWKASVLRTYIFFFAFAINIVLLASQFSVLHLMSSIGIGGIFAALTFQGSLNAFQLNNQILDGVGEFLHSPTNWLPDPVFHPLEKA